MKSLIVHLKRAIGSVVLSYFTFSVLLLLCSMPGLYWTQINGARLKWEYLGGFVKIIFVSIPSTSACEIVFWPMLVIYYRLLSRFDEQGVSFALVPVVLLANVFVLLYGLIDAHSVADVPD